MSEYSNSVIAFGDLKESLLYFDYVVPAEGTGFFLKFSPKDVIEDTIPKDFSNIRMEDYREGEKAFPNENDTLAFCPSHLIEQPKFKVALRMFSNLLFTFMVRTSLGEEKYKEYLVNLGKLVNPNTSSTSYFPAPKLEGLRNLFTHIVKEFQMQNMVIDCSTFFMPGVAQSCDNASLSVQKVPLVDTEGITFSQIIEFRKDKEAMKKMRQFRLFAYNNYQGKSKAFVEDDVSRRLDEYRDAVKTLGLKTRNKHLTFFLKSKSVMFAGAASLYSMISGSPDPLITASGIAAVGWKLADFAIELSNQKSDLLNLSNEHPVSYIADIKDKFEPKP
jgi:hypothetical protein